MSNRFINHNGPLYWLALASVVVAPERRGTAIAIVNGGLPADVVQRALAGPLRRCCRR